MAIMNINFTSRCLAMKTSVWVAYPTPTLGEMIQRKDKYDPEKRWPVVYMLHGAGGDGFEWIQRADMEQLCCQYGFIAVMPDAALSCYNDTPYGAKYYTYISEELPAMIEATFHASTDANGLLPGRFRCGQDRPHEPRQILQNSLPVRLYGYGWIHKCL